MTLRQVENVDIVADGGAVVGSVVIAKDQQFLAFARGDLCEQRKEVVRDARGIFTHDAARVAAGRVEVAEQTSIPLLNAFSVALLLSFGALGIDVVCDHEFGGKFCVAVGIRWAKWTLFGNGNHARDPSCIAIDGSRGGIHNVGDIVAGGRREEGECAGDIDSVVVEGDLSRFTDRFQCREMNDAVDVWMLGEDVIQSFLVGNVDVVVFRLLSTDQFYAVENFARGVVKVVNNDDFVVCFKKSEGSERANIAGTTVEHQSLRILRAVGLAYPVIKQDPAAILMSISEIGGVEFAALSSIAAQHQ